MTIYGPMAATNCTRILRPQLAPEDSVTFLDDAID
jgi:hypothetical protein